MPPKPSADIKEEDVLQAVVLCDPYGDETAWGPLTRQEDDEDEVTDPWCLLPIIGVPLLGWTLESLSSSGVGQVWIVVRQGIEQVRKYLESISFLCSSSNAPLIVKVIGTSAFTPGEVLREIDARALLSGGSGSGSGGGGAGGSSASNDGAFLLVRCGYIGNLDLPTVTNAFRARRKREDNLPCMLSVVKPSSRPLPERLIHILTSTGRLASFHQSLRYPRVRRVNVSKELISNLGGTDFIIRSDLEPVGVEVCSVEVPALFTENFDYQTFRPDFINGILTSDLLGKTILCEIVGQSKHLGSTSSLQWTTLVSDPTSYATACRHILSRRAIPFVPDHGLPGTKSTFEQRRHFVYHGLDVTLSRDCKIGPCTLVGSNTIIKARSSVSNTILGDDIVMNSDSVIEDSYVFDKVEIGRRCRISHAVIGQGSRILDDTVLEHGCVIGPGSVIGSGARLANAFVATSKPAATSENHVDVTDDNQGAMFYLGEGSRAYAWTQNAVENGNTSDDEEPLLDSRNQKLRRLGFSLETASIGSSSSSLSQLDEGDGDDDDHDEVSSFASSRPSSVSDTLGHIPGVSGIGQVGSTSDFLIECIHSLDRAFDENHTVENASIELKTLRMASNVPQRQVRCVVVNYICNKITNPTQVTLVIQRWGGLIQGLVGEDEEAMVDCLISLQSFCSESAERIKLFPALLQVFYQDDIVSEEGVIEWFKSSASRSTGGDLGLKLREIGGKFVAKLMEADSSSEEESD